MSSLLVVAHRPSRVAQPYRVNGHLGAFTQHAEASRQRIAVRAGAAGWWPDGSKMKCSKSGLSDVLASDDPVQGAKMSAIFCAWAAYTLARFANRFLVCFAWA